MQFASEFKIPLNWLYAIYSDRVKFSETNWKTYALYSSMMTRFLKFLFVLLGTWEYRLLSQYG